MAVKRGDIPGVLDDDRVAVAIFPAREDNHPAVRSHERVARDAVDVDPCVRAAPALPERGCESSVKRPEQLAPERSGHVHIQRFTLDIARNGPGLDFHFLKSPGVIFLFAHDADQHIFALGALRGNGFLLHPRILGQFLDALAGFA